MTLTADLLLTICLAYVAALFLVAALVDRAAAEGRFRWLQSPVVYTLSISVYCTSWTFYGAVGSAARNGLEFITIYLGPTLVFIGWFWLPAQTGPDRGESTGSPRSPTSSVRDTARARQSQFSSPSSLSQQRLPTSRCNCSR